jgi:biopolymer transport protein TolQ
LHASRGSADRGVPSLNAFARAGSVLCRAARAGKGSILFPGNLNGLLQVNFWDLVKTAEPIPIAVMCILALFSLLSWTVIFSKWAMFRRAREANASFLRAFRKAGRLDAIAAVSQQFPAAPLVAVFDFGYNEVSRQVNSRGKITNPTALERMLQLGISEEVTKLERSMNWLATAATISPFIGLFGTVFGIIEAFQALGLTGSTSMRTVAPGIANALFATALGLFAAIPAAVFYNYFGHLIKEMGARMEDFSLEFLNVTEQTFER